MTNLQLTGDKLAIALSMICVIHCLFVPSFLILTSGFLITSIDNEAVHFLILLIAFPISISSLLVGFRNHKTLSVFYKNIQNKWSMILGRNKEKILTELKESKEFMDLVSKSAVRDLSSQEKQIMKKQFYDILKTIPSLAIFMLPGGALLLPVVSIVFPELLPTAFQENNIDDNENKD